jgi:hypothetical protein
VAPFVAPDVLVLAGGGVVGEAWMTGVLAGIEDAALELVDQGHDTCVRYRIRATDRYGARVDQDVVAGEAHREERPARRRP